LDLLGDAQRAGMISGHGRLQRSCHFHNFEGFELIADLMLSKFLIDNPHSKPALTSARHP